MKPEHFLTLYRKINPKWIKYLKIMPQTVKLLEKNICSTLFGIYNSKILFDLPSRVMEIKTKLSKWDLTKLKGFCRAKETIMKIKRQPSDWETIIENETTDIGLNS